MVKYYSEETKGFYDDSIHTSSPDDAIEISDEQYNFLKLAQVELNTIRVDDGEVIAVAPPPPSRDESIKAQIVALESQQTPRRIREALLGVDNGWLAGVESQIEALRAQLEAL